MLYTILFNFYNNIIYVSMIVFIIPYRDRYYHKVHYDKYMEYILEDYDKDEYRFLFVHQQDNLPFNRGAMKNIGFLYVKQNYSNYKDITLVFNDIDTIPAEKGLLDYKTCHGVVKHYYGFRFALGGIVSITAGDFEKVGGFPNYWNWGYEDAILNYRVNQNKSMTIDRSTYFSIGSMEILHEVDSFRKTYTNKPPSIKESLSEKDGIHNLSVSKWNFDPATNFLNVTNYTCKNKVDYNKIHTDNILNAAYKIASQNKKGNRRPVNNRFKMKIGGT